MMGNTVDMGNNIGRADQRNNIYIKCIAINLI